jgi:hypothetical protein
MEVQMNWLELVEELMPKGNGEGAATTSPKKPPPVPGAAFRAPPMPVISPPSVMNMPAARHTMDVDMTEVVLIDDEEAVAKRQAATVREKALAEKTRARATPAESPKEAPKRVFKKPIPREDE